MKLGKGKLLRSGLNALYQVIHPIHGLSRMMGSRICLTNVQLQSGETKFGDSRSLDNLSMCMGCPGPTWYS